MPDKRPIDTALQRTAPPPTSPPYNRPPNLPLAAPAPSPFFFAVVTTAASANGPPVTKWTYTLQRAQKTAAGLVTWNASGTGLTPAYNLAEVNNPEAASPIPTGTPVLACSLNIAGSTEYWVLAAGWTDSSGWTQGAP